MDFATQQLDLLAQLLKLLFLLVIFVLVFIVAIGLLFIVHLVMMPGMAPVGVRAEVLHPGGQDRLLARHDHVDDVRLRVRRHVFRPESSVMRAGHKVRSFAWMVHARVRMKDAAVKSVQAFVRRMKAQIVRTVAPMMFAVLAVLVMGVLAALATAVLAATLVLAMAGMLLGFRMMMRVMVIAIIVFVFVIIIIIFFIFVFVFVFMAPSITMTPVAAHAFMMASAIARLRAFSLIRGFIVCFLILAQGEPILTFVGLLARLSLDMAIDRFEKSPLQPWQPQVLCGIFIRPSAGRLKQGGHKARQE